MEWTEETIARLRALWDEGHSTAEIGRRLGVTKNAVVGKAHRLNLPARPSPIRRTQGAPRPQRSGVVRRVIGPTLPVLPAMQAAVRATEPLAPQTPFRVVTPSPRPTHARLSACCWPLGEPGTPSFRFCGDNALSGKPYCGEHANIAYVKVRDRREDAA